MTRYQVAIDDKSHPIRDFYAAESDYAVSTDRNTGARFGQACSLFVFGSMDGHWPFVKVLPEEVKSRCCRSSKDLVRMMSVNDAGYVSEARSWMVTEREKQRKSLWPATDATMSNWQKAAIKRAVSDGEHLFVPVAHTNFVTLWAINPLYYANRRR